MGDTMKEALIDNKEDEGPLVEEEQPRTVVEYILDGLTWELFAIFLCTVCYMLAHGLRAGVWPLILLEATGDVETAAYYQGAISGGYHVLCIVIANPILGALSDYTDRRKFLAFALLGVTIDSILITQSPTVATLVIGAGLRGISHCFVAVAASAIAEISSPGARGKNMALIGVAFGIGMAAGQFVGGQLGAIDLLLPFYASAGVSLLGILFVMTCVPVLNKYAREASILDAMNPVRNVCIMFDTPALRVLSVVHICHVTGVHCFHSILVLYTRYKFKWDPIDFGNFMFAYGVVAALIQAVVVRVLFSSIGEAHALTLGIVVSVVEFGITPCITSTEMWYAVVLPCAVAALIWPATRALFSQQIGMSNQGQIMGALGMLTSIGDLVGDTAAAEILGLGISYERSLNVPEGSTILAGMPMFVGCIFYLFTLFWWMSYGHLVMEQTNYGSFREPQDEGVVLEGGNAEENKA